MQTSPLQDLVPRGTLIERIRADGYGLGGILAPTSDIPKENDMTSHRLSLLAIALLAAGCANIAGPGSVKSGEAKPGGHEQSLIERQAVVTAVDQQRRVLALKDDDGTTAVLPIASEFRDFEKVRVGDPVVVSYTEAIAWQVKPADKAAPGVSARETLSNPKAGEAPGGAIERALTVTATITAFDAARGTATLVGPEGASQTFKVQRPADLDHVRVGDLVEITYSEVRALSVRPAEKR